MKSYEEIQRNSEFQLHRSRWKDWLITGFLADAFLSDVGPVVDKTQSVLLSFLCLVALMFVFISVPLALWNLGKQHFIWFTS